MQSDPTNEVFMLEETCLDDFMPILVLNMVTSWILPSPSESSGLNFKVKNFNE